MTMTVGVGLDHLAEIGFVKFLHWKVTLLSLSTMYSLDGSHSSQLTLKERRVKGSSLRAEYLYKLFGITLHRRFVSSYPFI